MSDPFICDSESSAPEESDMFVIGGDDSSVITESANERKYIDDFKVPDDMMESDSNDIKTSSTAAISRSKSQPNTHTVLSTGSARKKRRVKRSTSRPIPPKEPSFIEDSFTRESEISEFYPETHSPARFDDKIVHYLDKQLKNVKKDFLDELKFELEKSLSFEAEIESFIDSISSDIREMALEEYNQVTERDSEESPQDMVKSQFELFLQLPRRNELQKDAEGDQLPHINHHMVDYTRETFKLSCDELMTEYHTEKMQLGSIKGHINEEITQKVQDLTGARTELERHEQILDELSRFFEERTMIVKKKQHRLREEQIKQLTMSNKMFVPETQDSDDIEALAVAVSEFPANRNVNLCKKLKYDVGSLMRDLQAATASLSFCQEDFSRAKKPTSRCSENIDANQVVENV